MAVKKKNNNKKKISMAVIFSHVYSLFVQSILPYNYPVMSTVFLFNWRRPITTVFSHVHSLFVQSMEDLASSCDSLSSAETGVSLVQNSSRINNYTLSAQITNTGTEGLQYKYASYLLL